jgi:putative peptidoglycan lipid II flippase
MNAAFIFGTNLAQVGIALASSLSGWVNALLLAAVLLSRGHWLPDPRLRQRTWRIALATVGMSAALAGLLIVLQPALARPDLVGVAALLGVCAAGALIYGALGALLGVVKMSEMRFVLRRQPGVRPADPTEQP